VGNDLNLEYPFSPIMKKHKKNHKPYHIRICFVLIVLPLFFVGIVIKSKRKPFEAKTFALWVSKPKKKKPTSSFVLFCKISKTLFLSLNLFYLLSIRLRENSISWKIKIPILRKPPPFFEAFHAATSFDRNLHFKIYEIERELHRLCLGSS
jgi:hypothetical protein